MKSRVLVVALTLGLASAATVQAQSPAVPSAGDASAQTSRPGLWAAWGGTVEVRWNRDLAADLGLRISASRSALPGLSQRGRDRFELNRGGSLEFHVQGGYFRGFDAGSLIANGGYTIDLPDGQAIDLRNFRLRRSPGDALILDFVGSDGVAWFYIDRLMYELVDDNRVLSVGAMDMRISKALAERIGHPEAADWPIADLALTTEVQITGDGMMPLASNPHWPGSPAPDGGTYEADLFMKTFSMSYTRCQGCSGTGGTGKVVFTPSSTLQNNINAGSLETTIPGQGALGTSSAKWAASIPWYQKFTGNYAPYGNDQHPYLIWNLYRTNADGRLEQIGRSGVKHAWLTTNGGCLDAADHDSHILGRGCSDTYGTGNNDTSSDLGPRSEIVPADGIWGRCGSIYDPNCTGSMSGGGNGSYDQRMVVGEQQISPTANPGATYLYESWYLAREDINIYNSMATISGAPNWIPAPNPTPSNQGSWSPGGGSGYKLGPAIDRWVDPANPGAMQRNKELSTREGHAKLAVKVKDLGDGTWRYDYAVMNFDYARAITSGTNPNIRVVSNKGFDRFAVPLPDDAVVSATWFSDGDLDSANDWTVGTAGGQATWTAPAGGTLDWGTLYAFSITVNKPPVDSLGELRVAEAGSPGEYMLETLAPSAGEMPDPVAHVTPAAINFSVNAGSAVNTTVSISNSGGLGSSLAYTITEATTSCASPSDVAWLTATPASGSVSSGATAPVAIKGDAASLAAGVYESKLCIGTSDPLHATFEVPVKLTVNAVTSHTIGGTVNGLEGSGLVLKLNGSTTLPITQSGAFTFPGSFVTGTAYAVTVGTQPSNPTQTCVVSNGTGVVGSADVTGVLVTCAGAPPPTYTIGGRVTGLTGPGLVLQLNGGSDLTMNANGLFNFSGGLPSGTPYAVTVGTQPPDQVCHVENGTGTMGTANVSNVKVACAAPDPDDHIFVDGFDGAPVR